MITRREALTAAAVTACAATDVAHGLPAEDPEQVLRSFLKAFEDCDLVRMEAAFAPDATYFDRAPRAADDPEHYRRGHGMPAEMRMLAAALPQQVPGPPYHRIDPRNLTCDRHGETTLCTFELEDADSLGRRTILLRRDAGGWKIAHIHASNVYR